MKTAQLITLFVVIWMGVPGVPSTQAVEFAYTLKEPGFVSVAVYDGSGRQVRTLQYGAKQAPGTYHLSWDGLDRYGVPQPAGQYQWRLLRTPGFTREFLVNLGTNITWREHDYWVGNHYGPSCLMVDDAGELYVGGVSSEGPPHLIKMSQDGHHLDWAWTLVDGLEGMAKVGKVFYWLKGGALQIRQASDGNEFWLDPKLRHYIDQTNAPRSQFFNLQRTKDGKQSPMTLAGGKDFLAVCYPDFSEVRLLGLKDDAIVRDETVTVPHPIHAAASPDGTLYVLTSTDIVTVDVATKQTHPLVTDKELTKPGKMTFDPAFGDLLVTNGSQVRRYHAADGKLVATYGRPEGRVYGVFNPLQFDTLLSIAADGKGGFFTAELCPRRVAHFTGREQIELVKQWFGGMGWEWQALIDPEDPTIAFLPIDYKHIGRAKIDYATKSWTLTHLYETPDEFSWGANATDGHSGIFPALAGFTSWWSVRHVDGKTYLVDTFTSAMAVRVDDDRIVPVACVNAMHPMLDRRNPPAWWIAALKQIGIDASSDEGRGTDNPKSFTVAGGYKHFAYSWADTNRNGRFDIDEVALGSVGTIVGPWGIQYFIDSHWNLYVPNPTGKSVWAVLPNESKDAGFPVWNWDKLQPGSGAVPETISTRAFWVDAEGNVYGVGGFIDYAGQDFPPLIWPNNGITTSRLFKWDRQGRLLFAVGRHAASDQGPPGEFADLRAFDGCIRGNMVVRDACSPAMVWTPDGLYAGKISRETMPKWWLGPGEATRENPSLGPWTDDAYGTQVVETSMGVLWLANDTQNTMVIRVKGWDGWEREEGKLLLPAAMPAARKQGDGLAAEYFTNDKLAGQPAFRRIDKSIWFGPMHGSYRPMNSVNPWARPDDPVKIAPGTGAVRWTGFIEAPVSEPFTFTLYTYGGADEHGAIGAKVRMWLDGKLVINSWDGFEPRPVNGWTYTRAAASSPVSLTAGKRVPIKIEYAAAGGADDQLHLYWESLTYDPRHVPPEALYRNGEGTVKP